MTKNKFQKWEKKSKKRYSWCSKRLQLTFHDDAPRKLSFSIELQRVETSIIFWLLHLKYTISQSVSFSTWIRDWKLNTTEELSEFVSPLCVCLSRLCARGEYRTENEIAMIKKNKWKKRKQTGEWVWKCVARKYYYKWCSVHTLKHTFTNVKQNV